jgi:cardiolipin synthase
VNAWFHRITVHSLAIVVSLLVYVLTTRADRERRPPSIAIAWVLGLIAVPYVGLPLYLFFGRRKLPRKSSAWSAAHPHGGHWAEDVIESFGLPGASPVRVRLHEDGRESRDALFEVMAGARERLDVSTYILGDDPFGRETVERLIKQARAGVRVRFLIDGVGALSVPRRCFRQLHRGGVETAVFCPLLARKTSGPRNWRNHRKWVIADEQTLWAGGRNLADEYFLGSPGKPPWLDLTFDLKGEVAAAVSLQFEADWIASNGAPAQPAAPRPALRGEGRAQFLPSGPDQSEDTVHALLIDACFHAERRILAATPYFVPDVSLEDALRLAARRGVKIDLVIPAVSNHILADFVRNRSLRALARAGIAVHLQPRMLHAKALAFDTSLALCGSVNLDSRSLLVNYESAVVFYGAREIEWTAQWIAALIPGAGPYDAKAPGLFRDLAEGLLLSVAYQL